MDPNKRIVVNTAAQYVKTIVNVLLSLYATRLILAVLGASDYGIYSLVAGVVSMLSFVSNAMVVSTQRFLSFYQGKGDKAKLRSVFNDSVLLHLCLGLLISAVLAAVTPLIFGGFLDIPADRIDTAKSVYFIVIVILFVTFITAPFRATLISHEDIVFISIVDVLDGVLKVVLVLILAKLSSDKLIGYAWLMLLIQVVNLLALSVFGFVKYEECVRPRFRDISRGYLSELASFAGWTVYSTGCIIGRTQGFAVLLDKFVGVVANASFGIAQQVSGFVNFVSESLLNAMRPQIVKAEGEGDRSRLLSLAGQAGKFAFLLLSCVSLPVIFYMEPLLDFWLDEVPEGTAFFCRMVMIASLLDMTTIGLGTANQAIGRIRGYSLAVNTTKILTLPLVWLCLRAGLPMFWAALCYVGVEFLCAMIRLPFLKITAGLDVWQYVRFILLPLVVPVVVFVGMLVLSKTVLHLNFIVASLLSLAVYAVAVWTFALSRAERDAAISMASNIFKK